jgi:hypothetical protein
MTLREGFGMTLMGKCLNGFRGGINWLQLWYKETLKINAGVKDATRWKSTTVFTGV